MPLPPLLVVTVIVTSVYTVLATLSLNLCSNPRGTCYCFPQCSVEILNNKGIFSPEITKLENSARGSRPDWADGNTHDLVPPDPKHRFPCRAVRKHQGILLVYL